MPAYLILAHECLKHEYTIKADSEAQARDKLLMFGNDPYRSDTLDWEIVDIQEEKTACKACHGIDIEGCSYCDIEGKN